MIRVTEKFAARPTGYGKILKSDAAYQYTRAETKSSRLIGVAWTFTETKKDAAIPASLGLI